jgi:hypothetical protein
MRKKIHVNGSLTRCKRRGCQDVLFTFCKFWPASPGSKLPIHMHDRETSCGVRSSQGEYWQQQDEWLSTRTVLVS